jgi:hypothetical protein
MLHGVYSQRNLRFTVKKIVTEKSTPTSFIFHNLARPPPPLPPLPSMHIFPTESYVEGSITLYSTMRAPCSALIKIKTFCILSREYAFLLGWRDLFSDADNILYHQMEGSGHCLIKVLSQHLHRGTEKSHEINQSG